MTAGQVLLQRRRSAGWRMVAALLVVVAGVVAIGRSHNQFELDHQGWVVGSATVGKSVTSDDRVVTVEGPDGSQQSLTMTVSRTSNEGDVIEVWYPPGRPEEAELTRGFFDVQVLAIAWMCGVSGLMFFATGALAYRRARAFEDLDRSPIAPRKAVVQTWESGFGGNRRAWIAVYFADVVPMDPRMVVANPPDLVSCAVYSAGSVSPLGVGIGLPTTGVFVARVKTSGGSDLTTLVYNDRAEFVLAGRRVGGQSPSRRPSDPGSTSLLDMNAAGVALVEGPRPAVVTSRGDAWLVMAGYAALVALGLLMPLYIASFVNFAFSPPLVASIYALAAVAFGLPALLRFRLKAATRQAAPAPPAPARVRYRDNHLGQAADVLGWKRVPTPGQIATAIGAYLLVAIVFVLLTIAP